MSDEDGHTDWVPNPPPTVDPTKLTTDAVNAATTQWRRDLAAAVHLIETRLDGIDKATELRIEQLLRIPDETAQQVAHHADVSDQKFATIAQQFSERDTRTEQSQRASKEALDAALLAAKELVGIQNEANAKAAEKTETAFARQIEQIGQQIQVVDAAKTLQISDLKERIDRSEGGLTGRAGQVVETRERQNTQGQMIGVGIAALAILVSLVVAFIAAR